IVGTSWVCTPSPAERAPCGSKSTASTRRPYSARLAPRLIVVVVLPTPPFWLHTAMIRAGPCDDNGSGGGNTSYALRPPSFFDALPVCPCTPGATCLSYRSVASARMSRIFYRERVRYRARGCAIRYISRRVSAVTSV